MLIITSHRWLFYIRGDGQSRREAADDCKTELAKGVAMAHPADVEVRFGDPKR